MKVTKPSPHIAVSMIRKEKVHIALTEQPHNDCAFPVTGAHYDTMHFYPQSYHSRRAFIMTQGPLHNTVVDFWRMVAQYNPPVIVMLTQLIEKGTVSVLAL